MTYRRRLLKYRTDDSLVHCTNRAFRVAANIAPTERYTEALDALLDLIDDDAEAQGRSVAWLTGDVDMRAGELAEAMVARAGRRQRSRAAEPNYLFRWP